MNGVPLTMLVAVAVLFFAALIVTLLRLYVRLYIVKVHGLDDWFMLATMCFFTVYCAFFVDGVTLDEDKPTIQIPVENIPAALRGFYICELFYILSVCFLKLSLGAFLLRLIKVPWQKWATLFVVGIVCIYSTVFFFMTIFQCKPISHFFYIGSKGTCLPTSEVTGITYGHAALITLSDVFFIVLPIILVWNLSVNRAMKLTIAVSVGLGAVAGISTIVRIPYIKALTTGPGDFFVKTTKVGILSSIEPGLGIIIGCMASLRPLFKSLMITVRTRSRSRSHSRTRTSKVPVRWQPPFARNNSYPQNAPSRKSPFEPNELGTIAPAWHSSELDDVKEERPNFRQVFDEESRGYDSPAIPPSALAKKSRRISNPIRTRANTLPIISAPITLPTPLPPSAVFCPRCKRYVPIASCCEGCGTSINLLIPLKAPPAPPIGSPPRPARTPPTSRSASRGRGISAAISKFNSSLRSGNRSANGSEESLVLGRSNTVLSVRSTESSRQANEWKELAPPTTADGHHSLSTMGMEMGASSQPVSPLSRSNSAGSNSIHEQVWSEWPRGFPESQRPGQVWTVLPAGQPGTKTEDGDASVRRVVERR